MTFFPYPTISSFFEDQGDFPENLEKPVAVVDVESAEPGEVCTVVARFDTAAEAEHFLDHHPDTAKVERGAFSIDVPEDLW
jgi:hypothetical protein